MLVPVGIDDAVGGEAGRSAMRVVDHDNVLDAEQMLRHRDGAQRINRTATGDDDRKDRGRRGDAIAGAVYDDVAGIDLVAERLGYRLRNPDGARVVAVDHQRLERDGLGEGLASRSLIVGRILAEGVSIELAHFCSYRVYAHNVTKTPRASLVHVQDRGRISSMSSASASCTAGQRC